MASRCRCASSDCPNNCGCRRGHQLCHRGCTCGGWCPNGAETHRSEQEAASAARARELQLKLDLAAAERRAADAKRDAASAAAIAQQQAAEAARHQQAAAEAVRQLSAPHRSVAVAPPVSVSSPAPYPTGNSLYHSIVPTTAAAPSFSSHYGHTSVFAASAAAVAAPPAPVTPGPPHSQLAMMPMPTAAPGSSSPHLSAAVTVPVGPIVVSYPQNPVASMISEHMTAWYMLYNAWNSAAVHEDCRPLSAVLRPDCQYTVKIIGGNGNTILFQSSAPSPSNSVHLCSLFAGQAPLRCVQLSDQPTASSTEDGGTMVQFEGHLRHTVIPSPLGSFRIKLALVANTESLYIQVLNAEIMW